MFISYPKSIPGNQFRDFIIKIGSFYVEVYLYCGFIRIVNKVNRFIVFSDNSTLFYHKDKCVPPIEFSIANYSEKYQKITLY